MMNATKTLKEAGAAKTVLIVEDNELNMKLFHDLLEAHGYNILQTKDGMEALRLAREHHPDQIGRASCRERVGQYVEIWVVAGSSKKKIQRNKRAQQKQTLIKR